MSFIIVRTVIIITPPLFPASEIRCLVSHRQALTMSQQHGAITLSGLVGTLEALLSVKECAIHAYLSIEAELVLLVAPSNLNPSAVQVRLE